MGIFDQIGGSLKGALGSLVAAEAPGLISAALAKTNLGNLQGLVNELQQGGLSEQVKSWLGNGANLQISPEQLKNALGSDQLRQLAQQFGVDPDTVSKMLADHLPNVVDQASPDGSIQGS